MKIHWTDEAIDDFIQTQVIPANDVATGQLVARCMKTVAHDTVGDLTRAKKEPLTRDKLLSLIADAYNRAWADDDENNELAALDISHMWLDEPGRACVTGPDGEIFILMLTRKRESS